MPKNNLGLEKSRLIIVGGKGGVGKTTTSASIALFLAQKFPEAQIMLISTDPAHSLGDVLELPCNNKPQQLNVDSNIQVRELDSNQLLIDFKKQNQKALKYLGMRGTYFDEKDIQSFLDLSFPGVDEVMALLEIARLLTQKNLRFLIVDTAPTGHTISMLNLLKVLNEWLNVFTIMQEKHHILTAHFARKQRKDFVDDFLQKMHVDLNLVKKNLHHVDTTQFIVVMLPEKMSFYETKRLINFLNKQHIPVNHIVVNRIVQAHDCPVSAGIKEKQERILSVLDSEFPTLNIIRVPLALRSIHGREGLQWFSAIMQNKVLKPPDESNSVKSKKIKPPKLLPLNINVLKQASAMIWIVAGKGGVGKTTVACATAICLAKLKPKKRVLLFSIDPAHSLADCLGQKIGANRTTVLENLDAIEFNAPRLLETFKKEYVDIVDTVFEKYSTDYSERVGIDLRYDRKLFHELMEMSPPGLEELMALFQAIQFVESNGNKIYDMIIFDTAPSGHLFRFLELPGLLQSWLQALFRIFMKYKQIISLDEFAQRLVTLSKQNRNMQKILTDQKQANTIIVTIPESMVVAETKRFIKKLDSINMTANLMIINMVRDNLDCKSCRYKIEEQMLYINILKSAGPKHFAVVPLWPKEIHGLSSIGEFRKMIYQ